MAIVELTKGVLSQENFAILKAAIHLLALVVSLLQQKTASIARMRRLFASETESTGKLLGKIRAGKKNNAKKDDKQKDKTSVADPLREGPQEPQAKTSGEAPAINAGQDAATQKAQRPGHGHYGVEDYPGADRVPVPNPLLDGRQHECPRCQHMSTFYLSKVVFLLHLTGGPLIKGTIFARDQARCYTCGAVITAATPPEVGEEKYAKSVVATLGIEHYDAGLPFYTIAEQQKDQGVPLPAGTQFGLLKDAQQEVYQHVHAVLKNQAADGSHFFTDDTDMTILKLTQDERDDCLEIFGKDATTRTGIFTTGIVSLCGDHQIGLFSTGPRHAGENLADLLQLRDPSLPPPLYMCDGAHRNTPYILGPSGEQIRLKTIELQCNVHGRRGFVDIIDSFPTQVQTVLMKYAAVYATDDKARELKLSPAQRLKLHQDESAPVMKELKEWLDEHQKLEEPNSPLGKAIKYMLDRWERLTRFLHIEGAALDNNTAERLLKAQIRLRKRSMFYMTLDGAGVGDTYLSLIRTCKLNDVNPYEYLLALLCNAAAVIKRPWEWLPWNFKRAIERQKAPTPAAAGIGGPGAPPQLTRAPGATFTRRHIGAACA
jgi:transposase